MKSILSLALSLTAILGLDFRLCEARHREWNDTGKGTIVLEEAWTSPEVGEVLGTAPDELPNLIDIHDQRLTRMDANGVDYMVLSCVSPCVQGISDPEEAADMARLLNNKLANEISNNTARFGAFAALSMHNATEASVELRRAVKELGFLGALVTDYQQSGPNNDTLLYYDQPHYDEFWATVVELDVPVYFHPRSNVEPIASMLYQHAPWLRQSHNEFSATLSSHVLGLCVNGVFDRFPSLRVIVGHLGERVPSDLVRIGQGLDRQSIPTLPMLQDIAYYYQTNLFETTSGDFATALLRFHVEVIGLDRIMFSVDYPFNSIADGTTWVNGLDTFMSEKDLLKLKRETAIKVLKLHG